MVRSRIPPRSTSPPMIMTPLGTVGIGPPGARPRPKRRSSSRIVSPLCQVISHHLILHCRALIGPIRTRPSLARSRVAVLHAWLPYTINAATVGVLHDMTGRLINTTHEDF